MLEMLASLLVTSLLVTSLLLTASRSSKVELETTSTATTATSEAHILQDLVYVHAMAATTTPLASRIPLLLLSNTLSTCLIINASLVRIAQSLIRVGNLLEGLLRGFRVVRVLVRMILDRLLLERLLERIIVGILLHTQQVIVILLGRVLRFLLLAASSSLLLLSLRVGEKFAATRRVEVTGNHQQHSQRECQTHLTVQ